MQYSLLVAYMWAWYSAMRSLSLSPPSVSYWVWRESDDILKLQACAHLSLPHPMIPILEPDNLNSLMECDNEFVEYEDGSALHWKGEEKGKHTQSDTNLRTWYNGFRYCTYFNATFHADCSYMAQAQVKREWYKMMFSYVVSKNTMGNGQHSLHARQPSRCWLSPHPHPLYEPPPFPCKPYPFASLQMALPVETAPGSGNYV